MHRNARLDHRSFDGFAAARRVGDGLAERVGGRPAGRTLDHNRLAGGERCHGPFSRRGGCLRRRAGQWLGRCARRFGGRRAARDWAARRAFSCCRAGLREREWRDQRAANSNQCLFHVYPFRCLSFRKPVAGRTPVAMQFR